MEFNLETTIQRLLAHPYFEKSKNVKELGPGHPEESVFVHSVQTADSVRKYKDRSFIGNQETKKLFQDFMNRKIGGIPYSDIAILTGLVHDIGKVLSYREEGKVFPINAVKPDGDSSHSPDHGYYGSIIVKPLLQEVGAERKIVDYIAEIVRLHLIPFDYYKGVAGYSLRDAIDDLKPRMEGFHVEVCVNAYADIAYNSTLRECRELIERMLSEPHFYSSREYFVE